MGRPYDLIVFDWEGTLSDPLGYLLNIVEEQAACLGLGSLERQRLRRYLPQGLEFALKRICPTLTAQQYTNWLENIQSSLRSSAKEQVLFEGAEACIAAIEQLGIHLAIATNKGPQSLQKALKLTGMLRFFSVTRSAGPVPPKPCPQMLEEIMTIFDVDAHRTLMIGDSVSDIEMALALNVECIGIDFYGHQSEVLTHAGALAVFHDYAQVAHFLGFST